MGFRGLLRFPLAPPHSLHLPVPVLLMASVFRIMVFRGLPRRGMHA